jgi:hypothetical protein
MKVHKGQIPILPHGPKQAPKKDAEEGDFQKVLSRMKLETARNEEASAKGVLGPPDKVQILHGTDAIREPGGFSGKKELIRELQGALDLIDFYASKLGDSKLPINEITPLISHLEERLEVVRGMESNPGIPEKLKRLISDMAITIGTEIAKFKRGDYTE